ncbi:uncharacterized protein LOC141643697 [Silene latifolia]|uniref:uncharacterized protein LOC141643697 n=1 Tax=Silene latifolia TaxID=37657 RepID=UPI003D77396E
MGKLNREAIRVGRKRKCCSQVTVDIVLEEELVSVKAARCYLKQLAKKGCYEDGIHGQQSKRMEVGFRIRVTDQEMMESTDSSSVNDQGGFAEGPRYTWCNNRKRDARVYERIYKALASKTWFDLFPNTGLKHFPIQISDHAPIELDLDLTRNTNKKPYKLEAWALEYEECLQIIKEAWRREWEGSPAYRVMRKLVHVRQNVKKWTLDKRKEWKGKWQDFYKRLEHGMNMAIQDGNDEIYTSVNEEIKEFAKVAAIYWRQRAKIRWINEGDCCTRYFFNWVKGRSGRNFILGIKGED